jgi:hypothetical protein
MASSSDKPRYGYKATPQLSAGQMAEYVCSGTSPTRRRTIIRDARFPKTTIIARYSYAGEGLVNFLADGNRNLRHLADMRARLERRAAKKEAGPWVTQDCQFSIEAIDAFERNYNRLGFPKLDCRQVTGRLPHLDQWPTRISVSLNITIHKPVRGEQDRVGGAVFAFSRGETSSKARVERSKTVAGLIYTFCDSHLKGMGIADPSLCFAVDVIGGVRHNPPGTFARKLSHIQEACEEIADRWKRIGPPDDYDGPDF